MRAVIENITHTVTKRGYSVAKVGLFNGTGFSLK